MPRSFSLKASAVCDFSAATKLDQHRLGRIAAVNDHGQVQLHRQIQLGPEHRQLLLEVLVAEQIQPQLANGHHAGVIEGGGPEHGRRVALPVLGIQRVHAHGVAELGETIGQGPDRRDLRGLHTRVKEASHASIAPALGHLLQVVVEIAKDDVAVAVDQGSIEALEGDGRSHNKGFRRSPNPKQSSQQQPIRPWQPAQPPSSRQR